MGLELHLFVDKLISQVKENELATILKSDQSKQKIQTFDGSSFWTVGWTKRYLIMSPFALGY